MRSARKDDNLTVFCGPIVIFEVFTAVSMKNTVLRDMVPYVSFWSRSF
jgi:hypothetical protein